MKKNCVICGKEFDSNHNRKKTCGNSECQKERKGRLSKEYFKQYYKKNKQVVDDKNKEWERLNKRVHGPTRADMSEELKKKHRREWFSARYYKKEKQLRKKESHERYLKRVCQHADWYRRSRAKNSLSLGTQRFFLSMKLGETVTKQQNTPMKIQTNIPTVEQFIQTFTDRLKGIEDSCKDLAAMVDADGTIFDKIVSADPRFNYNMLESMRKVGKGELYCELLFDPSQSSRKLLPLPSRVQENVYNEPQKIVRVIGGKNIVEEKRLSKMSRAEVNQLIDEDNKRVRSVEEQIAYVKPPAVRGEAAERYKIDGDKLIILAKTEFTMTVLEDILNRMKSKEIQKLVTKK